MVLELREVSRKTAVDGRLEITAESARRLAAVDGRLALQLGEATAEAALITMQCNCSKGNGGGHTHHFVESPILTSLAAGETVVVELLEDARLAVSRPHPL